MTNKIILYRGMGLLFLILGAFLISSQWNRQLEQGRLTGADPTGASGRFSAWLEPGRRVDRGTQVGKNHELVRSAFAEAVRAPNQSTVRIFCGENQIGLGTVIDERGYLITKASELRLPLTCRLAGQPSVEAVPVAQDLALDLALLRLIEPREVVPIIWDDGPDELLLGSWVATPGGYGELPISVGVVSGASRGIPKERAYLGIQIENTDDGLRVSEVISGSGAEEAGLQGGDYVTQVEEVQVQNNEDLIREVRRMRPGDRVRLEVRRGEERLGLEAILSRPSDFLPAQQGLVAHEGGPLSRRRSDFERIIQHDGLLEPHQCGGPLVNVRGQVVGINIARAGRVASFALPRDIVRPAVEQLLANNESLTNP